MNFPIKKRINTSLFILIGNRWGYIQISNKLSGLIEEGKWEKVENESRNET